MNIASEIVKTIIDVATEFATGLVKAISDIVGTAFIVDGKLSILGTLLLVGIGIAVAYFVVNKVFGLLRLRG